MEQAVEGEVQSPSTIGAQFIHAASFTLPMLKRAGTILLLGVNREDFQTINLCMVVKNSTHLTFGQLNQLTKDNSNNFIKHCNLLESPAFGTTW